MSTFRWSFIATLCLVSMCCATPFDYERYMSPKRTKPSLSIVNPLDVLRQRVLLEMARRQRENSNKQAEINKEILKSIGKRGGNSAMNDDDIELFLKSRYYDAPRLFNAPSEKHQKFSSDKSQQQQQQLYKGVKPSTSVNEKNINKATQNEHPPSTMNESNQEKVFLIDDPTSSNLIGDDVDDDEARLLFNLLRNRLYREI